MSNPKLIRVNGPGNLRIGVNGFRTNRLSYLYVEKLNADSYGYVEDRDVKRLLKWCKDCLKKRK
jgi:hypothetical protein